MRGKRRLLDWERDAIVDAYARGEKLAAIGAEFGIKFNYVSMLARRRGLPPRPRFFRPTDSQSREMAIALAS